MSIVFMAIKNGVNHKSESSLLFVVLAVTSIFVNFALIFLCLSRRPKLSKLRGEEEIHIEITRESGEGQTKVKTLTERTIKRKDIPVLIEPIVKIRESEEDEIEIKMKTSADKTTEKPEAKVKKIKRKDLKEFIEKFYEEILEIPERERLKKIEVTTEIKDAEGNIKTEKTEEIIKENEIPNLRKVKGIKNVIVK